jgi:hypothetical protein
VGAIPDRWVREVENSQMLHDIARRLFEQHVREARRKAP